MSALRFQRCTVCGSAQTLERLRCGRCGSMALGWETSKGFGSIYSVTDVCRVGDPRFAILAPYRLALIDLDEGPRVLGHAESSAFIGQRVVGMWHSVGDVEIIRFTGEVTG